MVKFLKEKKIGGLWARLAALLVVSLMTTAQMNAQTVVNNEKALTSAISTITAGGTIQLGADVTLTATVNVVSGKNFTLDLNGHVLKGTGKTSVVTVASGATFNISDSNPTAVHYFTVNSNGVWTLKTTATSGTPLENLTARPATNAVISVKGGVITGGDADYGGGICVNEGSDATHITMSGGNIIGNKAGYGGGGLYLSKKVVFTMTGGNIAGNFDNKMGGGVFLMGNDGVNKNTFTMTGGSIVCNASNGNGGGGVALDGGRNEFTLTDGLIAYNKAPEGGGVTSGGKFTMTGGLITGNEATNACGYGGGVEEWGYNAGGFIITGGTIIGNKAAVAGAGVYVWYDGYYGKLTLGGTAQITGNTKGGSANNVYLSEGMTITVSNSTPLATGANIRVTTQTPPTAGNPVAVTRNGSENDVPYFTSDSQIIYEVKYNNGHLELAEKDFNFNKITETVCGIVLDNENLSSDDAIFIAEKYLTKPYDDTTFVAYKKHQGGENDMYRCVFFDSFENEWFDCDRSLDYMKYNPKGNSYHVIGIVKDVPTSDMFNFTAPENLIYNGEAKAANVAANTEGVGDVTVKYYKDGDNTPLENAVLSGEYTVKIDVAEGDANCAATDLTQDSWKFTITLSLEVTTLDDSNDPADGYISLREAITYANDNKADNESITFAEGLDGTITLTSDLPKIKYAYDIDGGKRITIDGNGHTIFVVDGPLGKVIGTAENPVVFNGLTITGGIGSKGGDNRYGGAVFANCAFVTVKNSIISGNTATYGAGICGLSAATLAVTNSTFTGNNSSDKGGALYFGNNVNNSATLVNNTIAGNTASSGAAIYSEGTGTVTTYNNLVVSNGTEADNQLSGMSFTEGGCNYMTMDAASVFRNALPTGSESWLDWIPELVNSNKSVVNAGSDGAIVKSAFGVAGDDWTGVVDNYGNPRIGEPTHHIESRIDIGSYESSGLKVTVLRNRPYGTVEITNGTPVKSEEYMVTATFDNGMKAKLTATPLSDEYSFVWWSAADDTAQVVSTSNPYVFDVVSDITLKAVFVNEVAVNIYANPTGGGEVKIYDNKNGKYLDETERQHILYGTSVTIEATAFNESGFAFAGWFNKATGEYFSKTQKFTFDATESLELEARFTDQVIWVRVKKGN